MRLSPKLASAIGASLLILTACGEKTDAPSVRSLGGAAETGVKTGDKKFDRAIECWALTSSAYFAHLAFGSEQTGNVPNPDQEIYGNWSKEMALMAHDKGMNYEEYQELQKKAQKPTRLYKLQVEPEVANAIQSCIDAVPPLNPRPDPSWPT
ncbi:hypothetical protein K1X12_08810 [Hyphomonas sp. WL0036]|uniref:hypothetical protein n=1 Tax=Hyphomonas sediminis TaxID=2866160 RepID=UPI001C7E53F7|nr:hypothetical protein [Hyphomonas sediminis]MBY9066997.1 hypothetical protein [Hyphomonas sediminis]